MEAKEISYKSIAGISNRDLRYIEEPTFFESFLSFSPTIEGLSQALKDRSKYTVDRPLLHRTISRQYQGIEMTEKQLQHVNALLSEETFTIITAHQPILFTGPLYFVYKILSVIQLCKEIETQYSKNTFVPVFILGGEDHDFDEANKCYVFQKEVQWFTNQKGSVGRMGLDGMTEALDSLGAILGDNEPALAWRQTLRNLLDQSNNYGQFMMRLVHTLFAKYGLLVVNMDDESLKRAFIPSIKKELLERPSEALVLQTQSALQAKGFSPQAMPRPINLFYLADQLRERILFEDGFYQVNNTNIRWTEGELLVELDQSPHHFSPNVILRPLYQEQIFPNIAYVGGGGELAYWMERKAQFEYFNTFFPVLIRRNSALLVSKSQQKTLQKLAIDAVALGQPLTAIIDQYLAKQEDDTDFTTIYSQVDSIRKVVLDKAMNIDKSLESYVESEITKIRKQVEQMEQKLYKSVKKNHEIAIQQLTTNREKLYPDNGLQERKDNIFSYLINYPSLIDEMLPDMNPLNHHFMVFYL